MQTNPIGEIATNDLLCLISWPENSVGYFQEKAIIEILHHLCKEFGYGRIPQIVQQIEDIWRSPEKIETYREERRKWLEQREQDRKWLEDHKNDPE